MHDNLQQVFARQKERSIVLRTEPVERRKERLKALRAWVLANRPQLHQAMFNDFSKASAEVDGIEIFHVLSEIKFALNNLDGWVRRRKIDAPLEMLGTRSYIQYEPRGACLIISPWNYPFGLAAGPLISALAAGNCAIIKPSELTPHVSAEIKRMALEIFAPEVVTVIEGDATVSEALLALPFDHIFFTGSPSVGKIVMKAAAEHLSSVTLELGGKSPAVVTAAARIKDAAKRIAVAKFVNNGQTCIAPDYIFVEEKVAEEFIQQLITQIKELFLGDSESFDKSPHYARVVNEHHFNRLANIFEDAIGGGAKIEFGGGMNRTQRFFQPTILTGVALHARLMEEEIFGPILPVLTFTRLEEVIRIINDRPKPLAAYVFSRQREEQQKFLKETSSGGACINECGIQFLNHNLPFGGVNNSGMGKSHGYSGFLAFSNEKPVLRQRNGFSPVQLFYPPYTSGMKRFMNWFLKLF